MIAHNLFETADYLASRIGENVLVTRRLDGAEATLSGADAAAFVETAEMVNRDSHWTRQDRARIANGLCREALSSASAKRDT